MSDAGQGFEVRAEQTADHEHVAMVHRQAFGDHGSAVVQLATALRAQFPDRAVSLVAHVSSDVVGHVMLSPGILDAPRRLVDVWVLSPLGVSPGQQGRGVGGALVRAALEAAEGTSFPLVLLEGSPHYYPRFGFGPGCELGLRKPSLRIPDAAFQAVRLRAYEPWMTGTLVYPHVFWELDCVGLRNPG